MQADTASRRGLIQALCAVGGWLFVVASSLIPATIAR
ncbi:MAG: twin-arginine translocation signal domain-containing protein [Verrucomicrobiaceae bacterium]|nr:MAG: twin-arginine translocation signal domain-containing protein [Verrucomicrobiaceae bacterium]